MRRERTPRDDDEDEPDVPLRERMTRLDGELVEAREVLERVAPGEPRVQAPATVAEAFALADAAQAAKAKENVRHPPVTRRTHVDDARRTPRAAGARAASPARASRPPPGRTIPARGNRVDPFSSSNAFFFSFRAGSVSASASTSRARRFRSDPCLYAIPSATALFKQKHKKGQGDDKAKEKDVPAWWRYVDPFFREVHAGDLHAVLPPRRWDDDPDLRLPPLGRKHDVPFEDGLPKPPTPVLVPPASASAPPAPPLKLEPPPPASVSVGVPGVSTIVGPSIPLGPAIPVGMPPVPPASAAGASTATLPGALPHAGARASAAPLVPPPPPGAAAGGDLLSLLTPDEVAALFRQRVAFEETANARRKATAAAARACACEVDDLEAWLGEGGDAPGERGAERKKNEKDKGKQHARESFDDDAERSRKEPREEGDVAAGLRRWLRDDAAEAALAVRDARAAAAVPVAPATLPDPYARRHPYPPPKVCAVIKSDADGVVYVAGERPGAPGSTPPPIGTAGLAPAPVVVAVAGVPSEGLAAAAAAAAGAPQTRAGSSERRSPSVSGLVVSPSSDSLRGDADFPGAGAGDGPGTSGLGSAAVKPTEPAAPAPLTEEEKASLELCRRAFGVRGDLPHCFGSARLDETALPLHTTMLFDRHFWLAKAVGALPSAAPQTPWISPSPVSRAREAATAAAAEVAEAEGEAGKKAGAGAAAGGGPGGRCAVCVVQKKGRCGTDTAPARCLRRGGRGRADALEDPFDDAREPSEEPLLELPAKAESAVKAESAKPGPSAAPARPPPARPPPTPLPAASTAAIALMRAAERRERRRAAAAARREARKQDDERRVSDDASSPVSSLSSSSSSESDSEPASASAELETLSAALDEDPALRAAAPRDEVEGETLALQYELMWQQQANRHVITSLLGRVLDAADEEGARFAEMEGELAEAAAYVSKTREVRRILKREKRDADQRLALERAAAVAAASSRVGAQRRDADGNVIVTPSLPEDAAAAAAAAAAQNAGFGRALGVGPGGSPKTAAAAAAAAAAHAAKYGAYHGRSPSGRPRIPKHVQDRFAGGVRIGGANALRLGLPGVDAGGVPGAARNLPGALPGVGALGGSARAAGSEPLPGIDGGQFFPGVPTTASAAAVAPGAASFSPSRFAPPEVLVDTVHAAAAHAESKPPIPAKGGCAKQEKRKDAFFAECAVCAGTAETSKCREMLRCSRCALPTHPRCYGVKSVAAALAAGGGKEGKDGWLCWVCRDACDRGKANTPAVAAAAATTPAGARRPSLEEKLAMFRGVSCVLCPVQLGAFKQCADGRWCHVACAQWVAETSVDESDVCRAIRGVQQIPRERARHPCVACGRTGGVSTRCSFGHCQVTFHPLCARRAGFYVRASDGHKTSYRAYCDKHSPAMAERDRARGVAAPVMPPPLAPAGPEPGGGASASRTQPQTRRAPVAAERDEKRHAGVGLRASFPGAPGTPGTAPPAPPRASSLAAEPTARLELTASALRRARAELTKGLALCRAVLRRETVKCAAARADAAVARARVGVAEPFPDRLALGAGDASRDPHALAPTPPPHPGRGSPGVGPRAPGEASPTGPSGVTPVAPKRARSRATRGKPRASKDPGPAPGFHLGDEDDEQGRAKRARRSGSGGSVLRDGGTGDVSSRDPGGWSLS